jgi:hypothetical protein
MGPRLRHISGDNLERLEMELQSVQANVVVIGVTQAIGGRWYIHFLVQSLGDVPVSKPTQVKKKQKGEL